MHIFMLVKIANGLTLDLAERKLAKPTQAVLRLSKPINILEI